MAGRRLLKQLHERLIKEARAAGHEATPDGEAEAIEYVLTPIAEGTTLKDRAVELKCSRGMLYLWLKQNETRQAALQAARVVGASVMLEDAQHILEASTNDSISVDREKVRMRQWLAERFSRPEFGDSKNINVNVNLATEHLKALDELMRLPPAESAALLSLPAEIVNEGEES